MYTILSYRPTEMLHSWLPITRMPLKDENFSLEYTEKYCSFYFYKLKTDS